MNFLIVRFPKVTINFIAFSTRKMNVWISLCTKIQIKTNLFEFVCLTFHVFVLKPIRGFLKGHGHDFSQRLFSVYVTKA